MPVLCKRHSSQWVYQGSAYGFAGEIERPFKQVIPTKAATVLGASGGRGQDRVDNFQLEGVVSFQSASVEVGGSFDECHNRHTSYASSTIEKLNILNVVTADRIVSRMAIYSPENGDEEGELTFNITGSHFDNLRIAGHAVDVKLASNIFHQHNTHSRIANAHRKGDLDDWLLGSKIKETEIANIEDEYHALGGMSHVLKGWKQRGDKRKTDSLTFSPVNHLNIQEHAGKDTELRGFGSIICVPKFGVVRLAELTVRKHCLSLIMLKVDMCSTGTGGTTTGGTSGGGSRPTGGG